MILQFSVSNYRCFRQLQTLNMAVSGQDKSLPDNLILTDLPGLSEKRWIKGLALYGANASGKTTILEALEALAHLVKFSARTTDPKEPITEIEPFALCSNPPADPTAFAVVFIAEGIRYEYRVAATRERIWHESLRAFPKKLEQVWFCREWHPESNSYLWTPERPTGFQRDPQLEGYTLGNMLFLSKAVASNRPELDPVFRWFKERLKFMDLSVRSRLGPRLTLRKIQEQTPQNDRIVDLLRHADLGITNAGVIEERPPEDEVEKMYTHLPLEARERMLKEKWLKPQLIHQGSDGLQLPLSWDSESAGTHRLFGLAGPWLDILANGSTVCVDELETSMHPLMVRELLRLFFSNVENPNGAQILFTTHNPLLLDATLLRRDQVWFTDKDSKGEAHLYPLTDYSPRKGESLVRGYLSGRYGAVPFVPSGLLGTFESHDRTVNAESKSHE
jgi:uncharacterized protein